MITQKVIDANQPKEQWGRLVPSADSPAAALGAFLSHVCIPLRCFVYRSTHRPAHVFAPGVENEGIQFHAEFSRSREF